MIYEQRFKSTEQRFWEKVAKGSESECWSWKAAINSQGYGSFWSGTTQVGAHRWLYLQVHGDIPVGFEIDHLCRNRRCVNPSHMEAVPKAVNALRGEGVPARCARKTHCPQGHAYDETNTIHYRRGRYCRACQTAKNNSEKHRQYCRDRYHRLKTAAA